MPSIFEHISYGELIKLIVCTTIDGIECFIPLSLKYFVEDIYDIVSLATSIYMLGWIGLVSTLELVPELDILPFNVITC